MEHLPLHAELTLPAREPRELRAACDPARPLAPAEQVAFRKPKHGKAFHAVYLDAYDYLNPHEVRLPQILMALLVALSEEPRWDLKQTRTAPVLWDRVRKILGSLGREVGKDLADTTGLPLLRSLFRVDLLSSGPRST